MSKNYSDTEVFSAVKESKTIAEVLRKLNLVPNGANYSTYKRLKEKLKFDDSHFTGQGHNKDKLFGPKRPIEDYLNNDFYITSHALKKRLIKEGYFEDKCNKCGVANWFDEKIVLELHHKDCNPTNNKLNNLDILCPNCHRYIHSKINKKKKRKKKTKKYVQNQCLQCGIPTSNLRYCSQKCYHNFITKNWPSPEEVLQMVKDTNFTQTGKKLGVTDNAVRKYLIRNNVKV